ncbi:hypothetical protein V5799_008037 [Amblyomma americanum]|uniref:Uncharacterized protein n=1 Tax=Amblyomma americanum TaxID=6943 RepID=A0AAQ4FFX6_AMBAM
MSPPPRSAFAKRRKHEVLAELLGEGSSVQTLDPKLGSSSGNSTDVTTEAAADLCAMPQENCAMQLSILALTDAAQDVPPEREAIENENTTEDEGGDENYDDEDYSPCEEFEEKFPRCDDSSVGQTPGCPSA